MDGQYQHGTLQYHKKSDTALPIPYQLTRIMVETSRNMLVTDSRGAYSFAVASDKQYFSILNIELSRISQRKCCVKLEYILFAGENEKAAQKCSRKRDSVINEKITYSTFFNLNLETQSIIKAIHSQAISPDKNRKLS